MRACKTKRIPPAFGIDPWLIPQKRFESSLESVVETVFNQGNGYQGIRGVLEESRMHSGTKQGTFIAGLYEKQPGQTPRMKGRAVLGDDFYRAAKAFSYTHYDLCLGEERFCIENCLIHSRHLNMKNGELARHALWKTPEGRQTEVMFSRHVSAVEPQIAAMSFFFKPLNYEGTLDVYSWLEADVISSYLGVDIWQELDMDLVANSSIKLYGRTRYSKLECEMLASYRLLEDDTEIAISPCLIKEPKRIGLKYQINVKCGQGYCVEKIIQINSPEKKINPQYRPDYKYVLNSSAEKWTGFWKDCDVNIEGDIAAQQGIRFCLSQLNHSYRAGLETSVGAKGLTGEGYGLLCFWDTEIYILPFFIYTRPELARQILMFRYEILDRAREFAKDMGYQGAMFPWMTVTGENNPAVWECILGEQHINAAIPYGIDHYVKATGDIEWLCNYGAEIVLECARFWADRVFFSRRINKYVINQVTGPDEYMEMVNNDFYTNAMAAWTLEYACAIVCQLKEDCPDTFEVIASKIGLKDEEVDLWGSISKNIYLPFDGALGINPQDDTFLGLDEVDIAEIDGGQFPLEGNWPWTKVLASNILKQPDVVLANYLLNDRFDIVQKKLNYEFYEPKTSHDSSLSPCIHSIMACELEKGRDAYDYFMYSARLDMDYGSPSDGVHLANAGGAWMSIVNGFSGLRWVDNNVCFDPSIPSCWNRYSFTIKIRQSKITVSVDKQNAVLKLIDGEKLNIRIRQSDYLLEGEIVVQSRILQIDNFDKEING